MMEDGEFYFIKSGGIWRPGECEKTVGGVGFWLTGRSRYARFIWLSEAEEIGPKIEPPPEDEK